jgi:hypothetical protein
MFELLSITAKAPTGMGETERELWKTLPHESFDLIIMNPPFTRATGHEGSKIGIPNPMFAAFGSSDEEQKLMAAKTRILTKDTSAHGNAGEASIFLVLADKKLRVGGNIALVMPLTILSGSAWENSRQLLRENYSELIILSITGMDDNTLSFSADTGMGECLIIGKKSTITNKRGYFVFLIARPKSPLNGSQIAHQINETIKSGNIRSIEDGPVGGTNIKIGNDYVGQMISAPIPESGAWKLSRIADLSLAQSAYKLIEENLIYLPTMKENEVISFPITKVGTIGEIGPYHADVNGRTSTGEIRGPFDIAPYPVNGEPTYPVLWGHDAERERTIVFNADSEGIARKGKTPQEEIVIRRKVEDIWDSASHCHFNRDFQFNSQSTSMQFTTRKTVGGRSWLSIKFRNINFEKIVTLWGNTTLGIIIYWWQSSKQQVGRGIIGKVSLSDFPILDVEKLNSETINEAVKLFDLFSDKQLLPIHEIANDENRRELDELFFGTVMGFPQSLISKNGPLDILRKKLSKEPSIRGGK